MNRAMRASPLDADSVGVRALLRAALPARGGSWPDGMRVTVDLILGSRFPMFAAWAPDLRLVYNDACVKLLGERHPAPLGRPLAQAFTDALRRAMREAPDAMVVDIGLPDMDGYQLAALLRAQPETRDAILIAATGYGRERDRAGARDAGFVQHLVKPVDIAALVRILQSAASAA